MPGEIRVYFEGADALRSGFSHFFSELRERAHERRCGFKLIACGSKETTCREFDLACRTHTSARNILLIDSDGPDTGKLSKSLCETYHWRKARAESISWMVAMMEAWFHADKPALIRFYGPKFKGRSLRQNPKVEEISKKDLHAGLSAATKDTPKGDYFDNKASHGRQLLETIDPSLVRKAAPNCERLFNSVLDALKV